MVSYVILGLGGLLFGAMVYRYDMHEREPWWMLVGAAIVGAGAMFLAFLLEGAIYDATVGQGENILVMSLLAGTLEELAKLAVPIGVLLLVRRHFNDPMDGLIYGSLAGLGAALFESVWWQFFVHDPKGSPLLESHGQAAIRLLLHTLWGGISGFGLGLIVMKKPWRSAVLRGLGAVMAAHILWDYFVGFADEQSHLARLFAALILAGSVIVYGMLVVRANKWSRSMHAPTSKKRLAGKIVRAIFLKRFR